MKKLVTIIGYIALGIGVLLIVTGYVGVLISEGFVAALKLLNPLNFSNFLATVVVLIPGALFLYIASKIDNHNQ